MELAKRWVREAPAAKGEWWLSAPQHTAPNRAFISWPRGDGARTLYVWTDAAVSEPWEPHLTSTDLKALKAIGRIEAARRLHA